MEAISFSKYAIVISRCNAYVRLGFTLDIFCTNFTTTFWLTKSAQKMVRIWLFQRKKKEKPLGFKFKPMSRDNPS